MTEPINVEEGLALLAKANGPPWFIREKPMLDGLSVIEDGRAHGMFRVTGERFEIELIVWLVNNATALLASQQQLAEWKLAYEEAEKAREVMRDEWNAAEQQLAEAVEVLRRIADESIFNQQRFAEDTDTDYFLRCFKAVKDRARDFLTKHRREG